MPSPSDMSNIVDLDAIEQRDLVRSGDLTCEEVVGAHLRRVHELNGELNAVVSLRPEADIMADARTAQESDPSLPLRGLPVAVKDLEDVAGLPTRAGSLVTPDRPAPADGIVAQRLRQAGAIIIGKTNVPEFGTGSHTFNEVFGVTRNPWDPSRSAGGSSGGAAAALAAGMLPIADGSDLGGSLRNPASFCGVVGLRPSIGSVPDPVARSPYLLRSGVRGPMGRSVADAAMLFDVLAGPDPSDPLGRTHREEPGPTPAGDGIRIAWGGDLGRFVCEPDVLRIGRAFLEAHGDATVVDGAPDLDGAEECFRILRGVAYRDLAAQIPASQHHLLKDTVRQNMNYGQTLDVDDVLRAERLRGEIHRRVTDWFTDVDLLALPSAQVLPFPVETEWPREIDGQPMGDYLDWMMACCLITATGCPSISIPAGFTDSGLPVGIQLVAPVAADRRLLALAGRLDDRSIPRSPPRISQTRG